MLLCKMYMQFAYIILLIIFFVNTCVCLLESEKMHDFYIEKSGNNESYLLNWF